MAVTECVRRTIHNPVVDLGGDIGKMSVVLGTIASMLPIVGTEAIAAGVLSRGALRWNYTAIHPNVYLSKDAQRNLYTDGIAAWLWTGRKGIISGRAAVALHGVQWIEDTAPIELIAKHGRRRSGLVLYDERIGEDEACEIGGLPVTTSARTALDVARRLPRDTAVAHLDALAAVTGITASDVRALAERYQAARGIRAAREAVDLMDGGARSPQETSLRLLLMDAGMPRPDTSVEVGDDAWSAIIAMGWIDAKVGVDFEEDQSVDGLRAVQNIEREELFQRLGWFHIRVRPQHRPRLIVHRVRTALRRRGVR